MNKRNKNWKVYFFLILFSLILRIGIIVSLDISNNIYIGESHLGGVLGGVDAHAYTSVIKKDELDKLEYMVTYILFPESPVDEKIKQQYSMVLKSVMHNKIEVDSRYDKELLSQINRFIIPTKRHIRRGENYQQTLNNYNFKLSKDILNELRKRYGLKKFKSLGPYLITTRNNLFQDKKLHLLYVNLNRFDNIAIPEVIKIYKKRLEVDDNIEAEFSLIDKLKLNLMAFIVPANEHIEGIAHTIITLGATPTYANSNKKDKK